MPFLLSACVLQGNNTQHQLTKKNKLDVIVQTENTAITYQKCSSASLISAGAEDADSRVGIATVPSSEGAAVLNFDTSLLHSAHGECRAVEQDWEEPAMEQGVIWS